MNYPIKKFLILKTTNIEKEKYWCEDIEKPKNIIEKTIKNADSNKTGIFWSNCLFIFSLNIFLISIAAICSPVIDNINNIFFLF